MAKLFYYGRNMTGCHDEFASYRPRHKGVCDHLHQLARTGQESGRFAGRRFRIDLGLSAAGAEARTRWSGKI